MPTVFDRSHLAAVATGFALLGSGGGGTTRMLELALPASAAWPITMEHVNDVPPETPCFGAAFVGSTVLMSERLPGTAPFTPLIAAAERWLGQKLPVVCSLEGGGVNGLAPFTLAGEHTLVDADLTGRAVPTLDQMSLLVDRVPGILVACDTGAGGVTLIQSDRALDIERVIRAATMQAGGAGAMVMAGFTVGDLREHSIVGNAARARTLGRTFLAERNAPLASLAGALGARLLGTGRVTRITTDAADPHVVSTEVRGDAGEIHRVVARSEHLAVLSDGVLQVAAPDIIVVVDAVSREVLEVTDLVVSRDVAVMALPAPKWWTATPERLARIAPSSYGLHELDMVS